MQLIKNVLSGLLLTVIAAGCAYYPQTTDIPLISRKGDLRIDAGATPFVCVNSTISYGITDKLALQAYGNYGDGMYHQAAVGYYKNLGNDKIIEVYSGLGVGYGRGYTGGCGEYQLYFTQLNLGQLNIGSKDNSDFGFGLKTGYLYSSFTEAGLYDGITHHGYLIDNNILLEPTLVWRSGGEHLRFVLKMGGACMINLNYSEYHLEYSNFNLGLGLNYRL